MFAVIPLVLTDIPVPIAGPLRPWDEEDFHHWLDPNRSHSLAHYWQTASWGTFDLRYRLYDAVRIEDPRKTLPAGSTNDVIRGHLTQSVVDAAVQQVGFVGDSLHGVMVFARTPCDQFGRGSVRVPLSDGSSVAVATMVSEIYNAFDSWAHELGHMFGLDHVLDAETQADYASPYDIMSAMSYGEFWWAMYLRDESYSNTLPDGVRHPDTTDGRYAGESPQRIVGPLLSGAQVTRLPSFARHGIGHGVAGVVVDVSDRPQQEDVPIRVYALDRSRAGYPAERLPAVVRTTGVDNYTYMVEVRRGAGYDSAIGSTPYSPPAAVVVHHFDELMGRMMYDGALRLDSLNPGSPVKKRIEEAGVAVHVTAVADDQSWADVVLSRHLPGIFGPPKIGIPRIEEPIERHPDFPLGPWPGAPDKAVPVVSGLNEESSGPDVAASTAGRGMADRVESGEDVALPVWTPSPDEAAVWRSDGLCTMPAVGPSN